MEKKYFWSLLTIMMVTMLGVGLASCDKVDSFSTPVSKSDIVGIWKFTQSTDYTSSGVKEGALKGKTIIFESYDVYNASSTYLYSGNYTLSANKLILRSNRGGKYTIKVAIKNSGRKMLMEGNADNGATFSYTLEK